MAAAVAGTDLVHSHTWYANLGGHLAKLIHGVPHVVTVHSLEPMRPWKAEQLGGGYALSSYCERTALEGADAIIAVSAEHGRDLLASYPAIDPERVHVIYNGIDTDEYAPDRGTDVLERYGVDPAQPSVVFVGRITRQKGLTHLLDAAREIDPAAQLVLCAGAPDTPELAAEIGTKVERVRATRGNVVWIEQMLAKQRGDPAPQPRDGLRLPVDLRAARHRQPRGDGVRGGRRRDRAPAGSPRSSTRGGPVCSCPSSRAQTARASRSIPSAFAQAIAARVNELLGDPARAARFGEAGRRRAVERFNWSAIAAETVALYRSLA